MTPEPRPAPQPDPCRCALCQALLRLATGVERRAAEQRANMRVVGSRRDGR